MEVWIIAQQQSETYGHGDFGNSWKLPTVGTYDTGPFHPAFTTEAKAQSYLDGLPFGGRGMRPVLFVVHDE